MSKSDSNPREYKQVKFRFKRLDGGSRFDSSVFHLSVFFLTRIIVTVCTELVNSLPLK